MSRSFNEVNLLLEKFHFKFVKLPFKLQCVICHNILINAKQTACGCKTCENCILNYLSNGPKPCPGESTKLRKHQFKYQQ